MLSAAERFQLEVFHNMVRAIRKLDAIDGSDPESAHSKADEILLECVPAKVRDAYKRVEKRCDWWAAG